MAAETAGVERALGAIGTTFRLMRLYPPTHPAVVEALKQIGEALPGLAALGTVEWKVGVTGLHWHGQHLLPRNAQIAELAGLLYARGVRAVTLNPGMAPDHVLALFQVATGAVPPDDGTLGRITLTLGRRTSARLERLRTPTPASGAPAIAEPSAESSPPTAVTTEQSTAAAAHTLMAGKRASAAFRPDVLPVDVEVKRAVTALGNAATPEEQAAAAEQPAAAAAQVVAAAAEFVGLTGSPQAVALLIPLLRHASEFVREAALLGLAEAGGREIARPAMPALKDESVAVRAAAVRAVAAAGDPTSSTVLV